MSLPGRSETSDRPWITGGAWGPALAEQLGREEALRALDAVTGDRPVVLRDLSFHSRWANSAALRAAGIGPHTPDPENGVIVRDAITGRPTGLLFETAGFVMESAVPAWTEAENRAAAARSVALYNSLGVTGFQLAVATRTTLQTYKALEEAGGLSARVAMYLAMEPGLAQPRDGIGEELVADRAPFSTPRISVDFAKFFMDGVPSMRTSSFVEPYLSGPDGDNSFRGRSHYTVEDLARRMIPLDAEGLSVKIHAVGDQATKDALDAITIVRRTNGAGPQHSIAHMNFIRPEDIARLAGLNVLADLCPPMWFPSGPMQAMTRLLGPERVARSWPIRTILESGADAVAGTDWPAVAPSPSPWPGLSSMVTRRNPYSAAPETHAPEQAIDLASAIRLYTLAPSRAMRVGEVTGSLESGKSADLIVLDRNLFEIPPEQIVETQVLATLFEGQTVHGDLASLR